MTDRAVEASHTLWSMDEFIAPPDTEEMINEEAELRNKTLASQVRGKRRRPRRQEGAEVTEDAIIGEEGEMTADEDNSTGYYPFIMKVRRCYINFSCTSCFAFVNLSLIIPSSLSLCLSLSVSLSISIACNMSLVSGDAG